MMHRHEGSHQAVVGDHPSRVDDDPTELSVGESGDQVQCASMQVSRSDDVYNHVEKFYHQYDTYREMKPEEREQHELTRKLKSTTDLFPSAVETGAQPVVNRQKRTKRREELPAALGRAPDDTTMESSSSESQNISDPHIDKTPGLLYLRENHRTLPVLRYENIPGPIRSRQEAVTW